MRMIKCKWSSWCSTTRLHLLEKPTFCHQHRNFINSVHVSVSMSNYVFKTCGPTEDSCSSSSIRIAFLPPNANTEIFMNKPTQTHHWTVFSEHSLLHPCGPFLHSAASCTSSLCSPYFPASSFHCTALRHILAPAHPSSSFNSAPCTFREIDSFYLIIHLHLY